MTTPPRVPSRPDLSGFWLAASVRAGLVLGVPLALFLVLVAPAGSAFRPYAPGALFGLLVLAVWLLVTTFRRYRVRLSEAARPLDHAAPAAPTVTLRK